MKSIIATIIAFTLWPNVSMAEEQTLGIFAIKGGYICNSPEQLLALIETKGQVQIDGCGTLNVAFPANVVLYDIYDSSGLRFALARYEFMVDVPWGVPVQYGFWGPPITIQASLDVPA